METNNYLAQNLEAYRKLHNLSVAAFSKLLDIPLSTLKAILKEGNTTLETVIRISQKLNCSLDMLVYDKQMPSRLFILQHMEQAGVWFSELHPETKGAIAHQILKIWEAMGK